MNTILIIIALLLVAGGVVIYFVKAGKIKDSDGDLIPDVVEDKVAEAKKLEEANFARIQGSLARAQGRQQAIGYLAGAGTSLLTMKQMGMFS